MKNKWIKIRESKLKNKYELWDSKSGKLYGIDDLSKNIIMDNLEYIQNSNSLETLIDVLNDKCKLVFDKQNYEIIDDGFNYLILSKDNLSQFVVNETTILICKYFFDEKAFNNSIEYFCDLYEDGEKNKLDIAKSIIVLILYKIILVV